MKLLTADKMRELEKRADASGNTYADMMERAGTLTAQAIAARWPVQTRRVLVLVGPGNNGGDGLVCARVLHEQGASVRLYLWKREPSEEDANWRLCRERGIEYTRAEEDSGLAHLREEVDRADYLVDAFLGTGVTRPIEGLLKDILQTIKAELERVRAVSPSLVSPGNPAPSASPRPHIIAVDLPSGLNPDTGALDPSALPADLTVTFAFPKVGQYAFPGAAAVGELVVADIGILREWADDLTLDVATADSIRALLPARPLESNKGTFGKALIACGSVNFTGAPQLAAAAAARVGAGLVTLALPETIHPLVAAAASTEITYLPVPDDDGDWSVKAYKALIKNAEDYSSLLVGCGFGRADSTRDFVTRLFRIDSSEDFDLPSLVIDADALNLLSQVKSWWTKAHFSAPPIFTPHPGEMSRLVDLPIGEVQNDRVEMARRYAPIWNAVVVLKGAFTVIAAPDGRVTLLPFADPALATAGTGDVLAGAIAGLLAQYRAASLKTKNGSADGAVEDAYRAAVAGGYVHGLAEQLAGREIGRAGVVAPDLIERLPHAIQMIAGT